MTGSEFTPPYGGDVIVPLGGPLREQLSEYAVVTGISVVVCPSQSCSNQTSGGSEDGVDWAVAKAIVLCAIMVSAVLGNLLVIVSVLRYDRLRRVANSFIVSLAFADLLVAVLVMPFNASQVIAGQWLFGPLTCDIFNANDVLFSTASLLHLCCISWDRYIAVTDPFNYERRMTRRRAALTLAAVWTASACLSHIPIHLGLYTTASQRDKLAAADSNECSFKVNMVYGVISSTVSFWTPAVIMIFTYVKIYREARRQEKQIAALVCTLPPQPSPSIQRLNTVGFSPSRSASCIDLSPSDVNGRPAEPGRSRGLSIAALDRRVSSTFDGEGSRQRRLMKREHKAAKTLGVIMGAFLVCWLPFFTWYLTATLCADACPELPDYGVDILFWVGYTNSALNPVIYPCFNRDFRDAFRRLLSCRGAGSGYSAAGPAANGRCGKFVAWLRGAGQGLTERTRLRATSAVNNDVTMETAAGAQSSVPMITFTEES